MPDRASRNVDWLERLAKWQGSIDECIKELNANHDTLESQFKDLNKSCTECRERMIAATTELKTLAGQEGKRWGIIYGIIASIIVGAVTILIDHAI